MSGPTKTVGVIGGMGPAATLDFFERILKRTKALRDQDHIRLIIDSNTQVPDRNAASEGRGSSPAPELIASARGLEQSGADFIVMACNAAHGWENEIRSAIGVPFLSMVQVTLEVTASLEPRPKRVGILAANGALNAQIYQRALTRAGMTPLILEAPDQEAFMETLYRIKSGDVGAGSRAGFASLGERLVAQGAQAVIAGCTEVPLVLSQADLAVPLISSTDALVERVIIEAGAELV
jgi:aspartate racemase